MTEEKKDVPLAEEQNAEKNDAASQRIQVNTDSLLIATFQCWMNLDPDRASMIFPAAVGALGYLAMLIYQDEGTPESLSQQMIDKLKEAMDKTRPIDRAKKKEELQRLQVVLAERLTALGRGAGGPKKEQSRLVLPKHLRH